MIDSYVIYKKADNLKKRYGTCNPLKIADKSNVEIYYVDYFKNLLGMYTCRWRTRAIFLNNKMDDYLTKMVAAHELGHDIFHRELAKTESLREFELFRMQNETEYEANAFAAHLLIDTDESLELIRGGYDVVQISKFMNTQINLMLIKLQEMIRLGYDLKLPMLPQSDFFKNIRTCNKNDY